VRARRLRSLQRQARELGYKLQDMAEVSNETPPPAEASPVAN
jgi:hypothetical protein